MHAVSHGMSAIRGWLAGWASPALAILAAVLMTYGRPAMAGRSKDLYQWPEGTYTRVACDELALTHAMYKALGTTDNVTDPAPSSTIRHLSASVSGRHTFHVLIHRLDTPANTAEWNMYITANNGRDAEADAALRDLAYVMSLLTPAANACVAEQKARDEEEHAAAEARELAAKATEARRRLDEDCVNVVDAIALDDARAIEALNIQRLFETCQGAMTAWVTTLGAPTAESDAIAAHMSEVLTKANIIQFLQRATRTCASAPAGSKWTGTGASLRLVLTATDSGEVLEASQQLVKTTKSCASEATELLQLPKVQETLAHIPSNRGAGVLRSGERLVDLPHYLSALTKAQTTWLPALQRAGEEINAKAQWRREHCVQVCRCVGDAREVTVAWGEGCPWDGAYSCQEYNRSSGDFSAASWRRVREDCR